jgi:3-methyladenine DNA glycosylase AlkD
MPPKPKTDVAARVEAVVAWLKTTGTKAVRDGMARYAIPSDKAFGVSVGNLRDYAKEHGTDHDLAVALWDTEHYEARMLVPFFGDPTKVTPALMDRWCNDFDNWAICDAVCFHLFDRTSHAFAKVQKWAGRRGEFQKRAAFALLASVALHDKKGPDEPFADALGLVEKAATDERNFVKKGVSWALRGIGHRGPELRSLAAALAQRLADSENAAARWVGKDALREFNRRKPRAGK